jgi:hypothetical protein
MNHFAVVGGATRTLFPLAARPRLWFPFLALCAAQLAALGLLVSFHHPLLLPVGAPLLKSMGGNEMVHYPILFYGLPAAVLRVNLFLAILLESFTSGVATLLFATAFSGGSYRDAWSIVGRRYPSLLLLGVVAVGLTYALSFLPPLVPPQQFATDPAMRWGTRGGMLFLNAVLQTLFAYSTAWVVLKGYGPIRALAEGMTLGLRMFLPTFLVVLVATVLLFPFDFLAGRPDFLVQKLRPEVITWLLGLRSAAQIVVGFFLTGALTYLFVWKKGSVA